MKREFNSTNGVSKIRRISNRITKKLERSQEVDINSKRSYEKAIQQEKMKSARTEERRQCVAGS